MVPGWLRKIAIVVAALIIAFVKVWVSARPNARREMTRCNTDRIDHKAKRATRMAPMLAAVGFTTEIRPDPFPTFDNSKVHKTRDLPVLKYAVLTLSLALMMSAEVQAQNAPTTDSPAEPNATSDAKADDIRAKLRALDWVLGPTTVSVSNNSQLIVPQDYVFLDAANTAKFEELSENLSNGKEVMVAPKTLHWVAYLFFEGEGYVKDDEKIDAPSLLKTLTESTEQSNVERRRRGWPEFHLTGWAMPPAYNSTTKRLEWATSIESRNERGTNFFTKILGRRGYTSVVLVSSPEDTTSAISSLNAVLTGYGFVPGETYANWRPGDKVAEYGLTGLIVGGAAAAAAKTGLLKGLWKFLVVGAASMWKLLVGAFVALVASIRAMFGRKKQGT